MTKLSKKDKQLLIDLADWCEGFFNAKEGLWGQEAAQLLRRVCGGIKS